jgi:hypothetical protein
MQTNGGQTGWIRPPPSNLSDYEKANESDDRWLAGSLHRRGRAGPVLSGCSEKSKEITLRTGLATSGLATHYGDMARNRWPTSRPPSRAAVEAAQVYAQDAFKGRVRNLVESLLHGAPVPCVDIA